MFETHKDRGRVLLAVRVYSMGWTLAAWALVIVWAAVVALYFLRPHRSGLAQVLPHFAGGMIALSGYLLYPRLTFYESGVEIPPTPDYSRVRYLRWDQVERASWDGDRLVVTGTNSMLAGGPVQGGTVRIPRAARLAVDQVLSARRPVEQRHW